MGNNEQKTLVRVSRDNDFHGGFSVHVAVRRENGFAIAQPAVFEVLPEGEAHAAGPLLKLNHDSIQMMMDELWAAGVRPSKGVSSEGQIEAIAAHLDDMRKIAFLAVEREHLKELKSINPEVRHSGS